MIEHKYIDLFVDYAMKRSYSDLYADVICALLFSHLLYFSFLIFSYYVPLTADSLFLLFVSLFVTDSIIFGKYISFYYSLSSASRLFAIISLVLSYIFVRLLKHIKAFLLVHKCLCSVYNLVHGIVVKAKSIVSK